MVSSSLLLVSCISAILMQYLYVWFVHEDVDENVDTQDYEEEHSRSNGLQNMRVMSREGEIKGGEEQNLMINVLFICKVVQI